MFDVGAELFRPPLGWPVTVAMVAAMVAMAGCAYLRWDRQQAWWRRGFLLVIRLVGVAAVSWLLAGPSAHMPGRTSGEQPRLVLLADASQSMAEADATLPDGTTVTRWDAVRRTWLDRAPLVPLRARANVELRVFDQRAEAIGADDVVTREPKGRGTHLLDALDQLARTPLDRPAAAVVLSDGHDTQRGDDPTVGKQLRTAGWRVFAVPVGERQSGAELAIHAWAQTDRLFDGQATTLQAQVSQRGFDGRAAVVELHHDGQIVETRLIDRLDATPAAVSFDIAPHVALGNTTTIHGYELIVRPRDPGGPVERLTDNNQRWVFVEVSREKLRVALFEGEPYWDTRFLANQLRQDPHVDLVTHIQLGPDRRLVQRGDAAVTEASSLAHYDMIILGKGIEAFYPGDQAKALVDYVMGGGVIVLARGRPFGGGSAEASRAGEVFAAVEPVTWGQDVVGDLSVRLAATPLTKAILSEASAEFDAAVTQLPDLIAATVVRQQRAASVVVLEQTPRDAQSAAMAAVVHQRVGAGQVFAVLSDGLWRWAFTRSALAEYETVYAMFWSRAIRWLAGGGEFLPGQDWSLWLSTLAASPDEPVTVTAASRYPAGGDVQPRLVHVTPDGTRLEIGASRSGLGSLQLTGVVRPATAGVHELILQAGDGVERHARLAVYDRSPELLDTSARPDVLKALTDATGGQCLVIDEAGPVLAYLEEIQQATSMPPRVEYRYDQATALWLIVGALGAEWLVRRRAGMV